MAARLRLQELDKSKSYSPFRCAPWCFRNLGVPGQGFKVLGGTPERMWNGTGTRKENQANFAQFCGGKSGVGNCQTCITRARLWKVPK